MVRKNTSIFISGTGSNLNNLIKKSREYNFPINIKLVISNSYDAKGLNFAKKNSIPFLIINTKKRNYENYILLQLKKYNISFICLAGFMKVLSKKFIYSFQNKIINIHPSILPKFKGLNTYSRMMENKEKIAGCSVHYVTEKLDSGKIIVKKKFYINEKDTEEIMKKKTQKLEYKAFPEAIIKIFRNI